jgi:hypothetical protein
MTTERSSIPTAGDHRAISAFIEKLRGSYV